MVLQKKTYDIYKNIITLVMCFQNATGPIYFCINNSESQDCKKMDKLVDHIILHITNIINFLKLWQFWTSIFKMSFFAPFGLLLFTFVSTVVEESASSITDLNKKRNKENQPNSPQLFSPAAPSLMPLRQRMAEPVLAFSSQRLVEALGSPQQEGRPLRG